MNAIRSASPIVRAVGVIGVVAALVTSVTYAALQSQATLTNNTISSATAGLSVNNTDDAAPGGATDVGFAFTGVVPGGASSSVGNFTLANDGTSDLDISVAVPTLPTWVVTPSGTVDNTKVTVAISCTAGSVTFAGSATLSSMNAGPVDLTGGQLAQGQTATCTASISMAADAFTGSSATATDFDFVFTGTAI